MQIYLASKSPRRSKLLSEMGYDFIVIDSGADENIPFYDNPCDYVVELAKRKATFRPFPDDLVIGADTTVYLENSYFGKPYTPQNAFEMLRTLSGKYHYVYTGVCLVYKGIQHTFVEESRVLIKQLSDEEIWEYIQRCKPFDKAGSYAIQDEAIVDGYEGSYTNIVGLPVEKLSEALSALNIGGKNG